MIFELAFEKRTSEAELLLQARGGEKVNVGPLPPAVAEVAGLDPALFQQSFEAVVGLTEADADLARHFPLGDFRVFLDEFEEAVVGFFFQLSEIRAGCFFARFRALDFAALHAGYFCCIRATAAIFTLTLALSRWESGIHFSGPSYGAVTNVHKRG